MSSFYYIVSSGCWVRTVVAGLELTAKLKQISQKGFVTKHFYMSHKETWGSAERARECEGRSACELPTATTVTAQAWLWHLHQGLLMYYFLVSHMWEWDTSVIDHARAKPWWEDKNMWMPKRFVIQVQLLISNAHRHAAWQYKSYCYQWLFKTENIHI